MGGNTPQQLINALCARIARARATSPSRSAASSSARSASGLAAAQASTTERSEGDAPSPSASATAGPGVSPQEQAHWLNVPVNTYPLFENALRAHLGHCLASISGRSARCSRPFTKVAAANPDAWFRTERTPDELITVSDQNRMVGFPYPKYLNAIMEVDQSAGVLIASVKTARELGVPEDRVGLPARLRRRRRSLVSCWSGRTTIPAPPSA